jgi:cob(I)alamin adenosyltransferase
MSKTKSYRDNLAKSLWSKREETNKKIETIIEKSDFLLEEEKKAPIQRIRDALYKELEDVSSSEEYQNAKKEKNEIRNKKKQVKQLRDTLEDIEKKLGEEEKELFNMRETYGDFEPL